MWFRYCFLSNKNFHCAKLQVYRKNWKYTVELFYIFEDRAVERPVYFCTKTPISHKTLFIHAAFCFHQLKFLRLPEKIPQKFFALSVFNLKRSVTNPLHLIKFQRLLVLPCDFFSVGCECNTGSSKNKKSSVFFQTRVSLCKSLGWCIWNTFQKLKTDLCRTVWTSYINIFSSPVFK